MKRIIQYLRVGMSRTNPGGIWTAKRKRDKTNTELTEETKMEIGTEKEFASKKCHGEREIHSNDKYSIPRYTQKRERVINQTSK